MKLLFASKNPAKIGRYIDLLKEHGINVITLRDLEDVNIKVEENGKDAMENAYIKAKSYYDATGITTIGIDDTLFIEGIPEDIQPGTHVRRVNGKELTDQEMIEYYSGLVKQYGKDDKLDVKWISGLVIYDDKGPRKYTWNREDMYFVSKPSEKIDKGYPLSSITYYPDVKKYSIDLTEEEKENHNFKGHVVDFIVNNLKV
ncbi:MAG: hypothetical protein IKG42_04080 [Clostridia bacterium]|nr:hypothetical protein [Clostridia bacterium]